MRQLLAGSEAAAAVPLEHPSTLLWLVTLQSNEALTSKSICELMMARDGQEGCLAAGSLPCAEDRLARCCWEVPWDGAAARCAGASAIRNESMEQRH